jgi:outer membrane protein assembly factor BamB
MRKHLGAGLTTLVLLVLAAEAGAQEWTRFRGPNGTGISTAKGVPVKWSEQDFAWRVPIAGRSDGQPVFWGDKVFLSSSQDEGRERLMICLSKADGKELWVKKFPLAPRGKKEGNNPTFAASTPAVDKDRVVALFADPQQFLVKAWDHSGKELWTVNLGPYVAPHGMGTSPIFYEDKVIVPNDQDGPSFVVALDAKSGKTVWKTPRRPGPPAGAGGSTAYGTPCVLQREGASAELLFMARSHGLYSLDAKTGAPRWEAAVFNLRCVASPVVVGDLVIGSCGQGGGAGNMLAAVKLGGKGDVTSSHQAYTITKATPYVPTPIALGDRLYIISDAGIASCVEAPTGRVLWSERVTGDVFASPIMVDGKIYCGSKTGECAVWEAADQFKVVSKNPLGEGTHTPACVDGNRLYFKTFTHLVCVGGK